MKRIPLIVLTLVVAVALLATAVPVSEVAAEDRKPDLVIEKKGEEPHAPQKYLHASPPLHPQEPIRDPIDSGWHELYPEYCNSYTLTSWDDNGDGVLSPCDKIDMTDETGNVEWYHVDEMTTTILVSLPVHSGNLVPTEMALEFVGGYDKVWASDLIQAPVCTYWHEVWPDFCCDYHITGWDDNGSGKLDWCDWILLVDVATGEGMWWHVEEVTWDIIISPLVVEPASLDTYMVSYTILNKGAAPASAGHSTTLYVDELAVEHKVVPVNLAPGASYTDTFRTVVECTPPEDYIKVCADNYSQVDEENEKNNCKENTWPCHCQPSIDVQKWVWDKWNEEWVDQICAPVGDTVTFRCEIHNDGTCCDLTDIYVEDILSPSLEWADNARLLPPEQGEPIYLHATPPIHPSEPITKPVCTWWHELYPKYCNKYHLTSWYDDNEDGVLSPRDTIDMIDINGDLAWYHVDEMTATIFVAPDVREDPIAALEFAGGYEQIEKAIYGVIGTPWHEVWPVFCREYSIDDWIDNGNGYLDTCDWILLTDPETGEQMKLHVEEVSWDMVVSPTWISIEPPDSFWIDKETGLTHVDWNIDNWLPNDFVLEPCQTIVIEFNAKVVEWSAEPDINLQTADAVCVDTGQAVHDEDKAAIQPFCPGDADMDNDVDVFDWVKVRRILEGLDPPTCGADADVDGDVDVFDWVKVRRIIEKLDPYPC